MTTSPLSRLRWGLVLFAFLAAGFSQANAQDAQLDRGDAVVTGFSGIKPLGVPVPPGADPIDYFFIDMQGPSAEIMSLSALGEGPHGQLAPAPIKRQITAGEVGQVFAVTLDDGLGQPVPNIYLGATSAYGIQIVGPDTDGDGFPNRMTKGAPGAQFMAGQFGPAPDGNPGTIWRVDGTSGAVSAFTSLPGNSGPGVGAIAFDRTHHQFFASDLDNGLIYRISADGQVLDSFDHGLNGRPTHGMAPLADDGVVMDITSPSFDSENPATWGYTQKGRMVWGMAVHDGRLYYAVAGGLQVWSIGIADDGDFAGDPRWELDATALPGDGPITDMLFDGQGRMVLAQRGTPRGSYDYSVFAESGKSSVVRYHLKTPDDPPTPSVWAPDADEYAIGMRPEFRQADGGIALGYAHDPQTGMLQPGSCNMMLWSTGSRLRSSEDPDTLDDGIGPADVHGLQGNNADLVRPQNVPPTQAYYIDYDDLFGDAQNAGHMGDVAIWQPCDHEGFEVPGMFPPGFYPPGGQIVVQFPQPHGPHTNLRLTKHVRGKCVAKKGGWSCSYEIRIKNTGPHSYFAPLELTDHMPGLPPGAIVGFSPQPPWHCWPSGPNNHTCFHPATYIPVGGARYLVVAVWVPGSYPKPGHCDLHNVAHITFAPGGSPWNTNPADDTDGATAIIPAPQCHNRTNLELRKTSNGPCKPVNPAGTNSPWECEFTVTVKNTGPSDFHHTIKFVDQAANGTKITNVTVVNPQVAWNCNPVPGATTGCESAGAVHLLLGQSKFFHVKVLVPVAVAIASGCKTVNTAYILTPFGGSPQNINPNDDADAALASIPLPASQCSNNNLPSNLKIEKTYMNGNAPCNLVGGVSYCRFKVTVTNTGPGNFSGAIFVHDVPTPGTTVWTQGCANSGTPPGSATVTCIINAPSLPVNGQKSFTTTVRVPKAVAQFHQCQIKNSAHITAPVGAPKNWKPADDYAHATAEISVAVCASPDIIKPPPPPPPPMVVPPPTRLCPPDTVRRDGRCVPIVRECPLGTVRRDGRCVPITRICPQGTVRRDGRCVPITRICPQGTVRRDGRCVPITRICPQGTVRRHGRCEPIARICPQGTVRRHGRCEPIARICPRGTVRRDGRCVPIARGCPRGTVRRHGRCVPILRVQPPNHRIGPPIRRLAPQTIIR